MPHPASLPLQIYHGKIKSKASEPLLVARNPRVEFVGSTTKKDNNISILLKNVDFSDAGKYTCHVKNPKEKNAQHNATIFLTVVQKSKCWPGLWCPASGTGTVGMQTRTDPILGVEVHGVSWLLGGSWHPRRAKVGLVPLCVGP